MDVAFFSPVEPPKHGPVLTVGDDTGRDFGTLLAAMHGTELDLLAKTEMITDHDAASVRAQIVRGRMDWADYRALFARALIVAIPLRPMATASGIGTLLEAMAMAKPIVVSDSPGLKDYAIPDETALVVPCGDPDAMRAAIRRLAADPALRERLGRGARAYVETFCSYRAVGQRMAHYLRARVTAAG